MVSLFTGCYPYIYFAFSFFPIYQEKKLRKANPGRAYARKAKRHPLAYRPSRPAFGLPHPKDKKEAPHTWLRQGRNI
jgi:hypothetical protein